MAANEIQGCVAPGLARHPDRTEFANEFSKGLSLL